MHNTLKKWNIFKHFARSKRLFLANYSPQFEFHQVLKIEGPFCIVGLRKNLVFLLLLYLTVKQSIHSRTTRSDRNLRSLTKLITKNLLKPVAK
jgi:hypothetical protein